MNKTAVFPGSFDPFTLGHESIVRRAFPLFDKIIIAIGSNSTKNNFFSVQERIELIQMVFNDIAKIEVTAYSGLTVDFCKEVKADFILRGIRTSADFEYERAVAQMNKSMLPNIESIILLTTPELTPVTSTIVRDILLHNGDVSKFLPKKMNIKKVLNKR